ncbi:MAG: hydroxysqualene dehydroxylase HpnE [Rhodopirellula sp. JB044]|uniref:hydroxysqualene dehydroxylase HpnE n=1 Tax=Rhodopirellula sp. JB044 TaxID=3342844 RepID=UPI00370A9201
MTKDLSIHSADRKHIVIVGGGIAGLAAAMALTESKRNTSQSTPLDVTVLESRKTTGGRAGSFVDPLSGATADYCQHVAMGCCTNFIDLINDAGLADQFSRDEELQFYHPSTGLSSFRAHPILPPPMHLNSALSGLAYLSSAQKLRIRTGLWSLMRTRTAKLANTTAARWLAAHHQDDVVRSRFWDPILVSALGDLPERVSMASARKVIVDGFAAARTASNVLVPRSSLSTIFGQQMTSVLKQRGVAFRLGTSVRSLQPLSTKPTSLSPSPRHRDLRHSTTIETSHGETIDADQVILATSWRSASRLIRSLNVDNEISKAWQTRTVDALDSISPSPITGLHLWLDRNLTRHPHVVMVGTTAHWLFQHGIDPQNASAGYYHQVVISGRHEWSDASKEQLVERVMDELRTAFPESQAAQLMHWRVVTDPAAVFSVSPEFEAQRPTTQTPIDWLHLAGDYVQTGWPATMEGAVISGRMAADRVRQTYQAKNTAPPRPSVLPGLPRGLLARCCIRD